MDRPITLPLAHARRVIIMTWLFDWVGAYVCINGLHTAIQLMCIFKTIKALRPDMIEDSWVHNIPFFRINFRQRNYAEVTTQLHGAISVVEEFTKYQSIPQIKQLTDRWVWPNRVMLVMWSSTILCIFNRLESVQYDLSQLIRVDFEKSFSMKGAPVGSKESSLFISFKSSLSLSLSLSPRLVPNISCMMPARSRTSLGDERSMMSQLHHHPNCYK